MPPKVSRITVDLSAYPDLVVIYLGMRVRTLRGLGTLMRFGPLISRAVAAKPEGLLLHEPFFFSLFPPHAAMRQYWRDFESLETWARSLPHQSWWKEFLGNSGGTGFWHETYFMRGGMEAIYDDLGVKIGFGQFAPNEAAKGPMFSARRRLGLAGESALRPAVEDKGDSA
jgi:Monooxygenase af470-like